MKSSRPRPAPVFRRRRGVAPLQGRVGQRVPRLLEDAEEGQGLRRRVGPRAAQKLRPELREPRDVVRAAPGRHALGDGREAEIREAEVRVDVDEDVLGLDVAVDDAAGVAVRERAEELGRQALGDADDVAERPLVERAPRVRRLGGNRVIPTLDVPRARVPKEDVYASRPFREMIARRKLSRNEWETTERGAPLKLASYCHALFLP